MGLKRFMSASPFDAPETPRAKGKGKRKGDSKPTVAGGGDPGIYKTAIEAVRHFRRRYRDCWQRVKQRIEQALDPREVIFPFGTLLMNRRHGYRCEDPLLDWCVRVPAPP